MLRNISPFFIVAFFGFFCSSCSVNTIQGKTSELQKKSYTQQEETLKSCIEPLSKHPFLLIGHQAGDSTHYLKNLKKLKKKTSVQTPIQLMDHAFGPLGLNGIEIDVQMFKDPQTSCGQKVYVAHDAFGRSNAKLCKQLEVHTLEKALKHFLEKDYHKSKKIYIELKTSWITPFIQLKKLNEHEKALSQKTLEVVADVLAKHPKGKKAIENKSISFASFSFRALELLAGKQKGKAFQYYQILSAESRNFRKKLIKSKWITGVWFDYGLNGINQIQTKVSEEPVTTFVTNLNKARKKAGLSPFSFYLGLQYTKFSCYQKSLCKKKPRLNRVGGFIFHFEGRELKQ